MVICKNTFIIEYWVNTSGGYDNRYIEIESDDENEALIIAKKDPSTRRGKDFKIYNK